MTKRKHIKILTAWEQAWSAQTGPAAGENESGIFYSQIKKVLLSFKIPEITDSDEEIVSPNKKEPIQVKIAEIETLKFRKVLHSERLKDSQADADLSFLMNKYHSKYFQLKIVLHRGVLYFLGPEISKENIKTRWSHFMT